MRCKICKKEFEHQRVHKRRTKSKRVTCSKECARGNLRLSRLKKTGIYNQNGKMYSL